MSPTNDRGSMSVYAAILAPALLYCVTLFANGAARWDTWRDANDAAAAAARAAVQPQAADFAGGRVQLGDSARGRAEAVLAASGYPGSVSIEGNAVAITVVAKVDYVFPLSPFGATVEASSRADLSVTER